MTDPRPDDWDDDRLGTAFQARASKTPPTPTLLIDEVLARNPARTGSLLGWAPVPAMALVLVLIGVVAGQYIGRPNPGDSGRPTDPQGTVAADPVLAALGDPMSVSEALVIRDDPTARELVVSGFLSAQPIMFCPFDPGPQNPTRLMCSADRQWLMERPEDLYGASTTGSNELRSPEGPALHPSFALVEPPVVPIAKPDNTSPVPVVLLGHFHDRRAALCQAADRSSCEGVFVVDRVVEDNGRAVPVRTSGSTANTRDREADVDALVAVPAPNASVVSRQLLTTADAIGKEPILSSDQLVPYIDQSKLAWLVTTVDLTDVPAVRTFMLLDGSNWFAEVTASGAVVLERSAPAPSGRPSPQAPSAQPGSFDTAPTSVLGIRVQSIREVAEFRGRDELPGYRDEYAIRGYYLAPRPGVTCEVALPAMHAPTPPCDEARHWLLGDPLQFGVEQGQLRSDPDPFAPVLNPLIPVDVPFEVGETWDGDVPKPQPVVVLGHFADTRVDSYRGDAYFVIDALDWMRDMHIGSIDRVTRLTDAPTEVPSEVIARLEAVSPREALATWATVIDSADFAALEPYVTDQVTDEFTTGPPVWLIRRLVVIEDELQPQWAVEAGFTADGRSRIWLAETDSSQADLVTSHDLQDLDASTELLRVFDFGNAIRSIAPASGMGSAKWHELGPVPDFIEVARGRSDREVAVRWQGAPCAQWRLGVHSFATGILLEPRADDPGCDGALVKHAVLIEFDHPVDLDLFHTEDLCCG